MITSDRIKTLTRPLKFKEKIFTSDFYSLIELHILLYWYLWEEFTCSNHECKGGTVTHTFTWDNWKYGMYSVNSYKQVAITCNLNLLYKLMAFN